MLLATCFGLVKKYAPRKYSSFEIIRFNLIDFYFNFTEPEVEIKIEEEPITIPKETADPPATAENPDNNKQKSAAGQAEENKTTTKSNKRTTRSSEKISDIAVDDEFLPEPAPTPSKKPKITNKLISDFFTPEEVAVNQAENHALFYDDSVPCEATAAPEEEREPCLEPDCDRKFISYFSMMRHVAFFHRAKKTATILRQKMPRAIKA